MIVLFTDFGLQGPYVGQLHVVLGRNASAPRVVDLMHDAPAFRPAAAAHLLAALVADLPGGTVVVGVVDPGVGTARDPVVVEADGRWLVGPDNGLFDTVAARASGSVRWWRITRAPEGNSATFHGRDLFAPVAAALARGEPVPGESFDRQPDAGAAADLAEVIYIDAFGNAMTGLRADAGVASTLVAGNARLDRVRTFADAGPGQPMWLANSIGLVEIAANQASAAETLGLEIGTPVGWDD